MSFGLLAIAAALSGPGGSSRQLAPIKWLIIELPDGERGGIGRIQGKGSSAEIKGWQDYLQLARSCGARFPMFSNNWSHSVHIISWSAPNDRAVVECLKAKLPARFNAGLAEPQADRGFTDPDTAQFRDLETPESVRKKRN